MFSGQFTYSIDSKGRISIPAKLRRYVSAEANDTFKIIRGTSICIDVYPYNEWLILEEKLNRLNPFNPDEIRFKRTILQHVSEDKLDSQSRILIPQTFLEYAKIEKEVLILGVGNKIEVWNPKIFDDYMKQSDQTFEQIAAKVMS